MGHCRKKRKILYTTRISALGIADRFAFIGAIDSKEVFAFLRFLDIYVQPSRSVGFSNSVLEAMAAGLPIIVTDVGGNKEIVEHQVDGIKVPPMSPMELKNGICFYLNYPDIAQKYGNDAKNKVMNKFLFEAMLNNYLRFYSDQIKKNFKQILSLAINKWGLDAVNFCLQR